MYIWILRYQQFHPSPPLPTRALTLPGVPLYLSWHPRPTDSSQWRSISRFPIFAARASELDHTTTCPACVRHTSDDQTALHVYILSR